jgi:putative ABC transport system permease protein
MFIGFVIATPVTLYMKNQWLQNFADRIEIAAAVFLLAGLSIILVALATVSWQSIKAAIANPVDSLRSE